MRQRFSASHLLKQLHLSALTHRSLTSRANSMCTLSSWRLQLQGRLKLFHTHTQTHQETLHCQNTRAIHTTTHTIPTRRHYSRASICLASFFSLCINSHYIMTQKAHVLTTTLMLCSIIHLPPAFFPDVSWLPSCWEDSHDCLFPGKWKVQPVWCGCNYF